MKTILPLSVVAASFVFCVTARATAPVSVAPASVPFLANATVCRDEMIPLTFSDTAEAVKLRRVYLILATGDHDYKGHRVKAMHSVEAAGKLLGMDLGGDLKDRTSQV